MKKEKIRKTFPIGCEIDGGNIDELINELQNIRNEYPEYDIYFNCITDWGRNYSDELYSYFKDLEVIMERDETNKEFETRKKLIKRNEIQKEKKRKASKKKREEKKERQRIETIKNLEKQLIDLRTNDVKTLTEEK